MQKLFKFLDFLLVKISMSIMGIMAVLVILSVFLRYFLGIAFVWSEELITFLFIFTTFFGSVLAVKEDDHINIDFFFNRMPVKYKKAFKVFFSFIIIVLQIFIIKTSITWVAKVGNVYSPGLRIPFTYIYLMLPVSSMIMIIYALLNMIKIIKNNLI